MSDLETNDVLISILEMLKQHAVALGRHRGWMIAIADTLREIPELKARLEEHPLYDQGHDPILQKTDAMIRNIDALIQRLKAG